MILKDLIKNKKKHKNYDKGNLIRKTLKNSSHPSKFRKPPCGTPTNYNNSISPYS